MTEGAVTVRAATFADVEGGVAIERAAFSDPWTAKSFRELVGRPEVLFDVAVRPRGEAEGDEVIGFVIVYTVEGEGDLANLAIAASARGHGEGRRLLRHAIQGAVARGVQLLFLEVRESNEAARALYDSEGFMEVGRRAKYYVRPAEDALILRKELP